jgi:UTP--glucose-1-phosphate uridylyltransferase
VEKPDPAQAPSTLTITGRYIVQPEIFGHLSNAAKGTGGEIQLTDSLAKLIGTQAFHGFRFEGKRYDCGSRTGLLKANIAHALNNNENNDHIADFLRDILKTARRGGDGEKSPPRQAA